MALLIAKKYRRDGYITGTRIISMEQVHVVGSVYECYRADYMHVNSFKIAHIYALFWTMCTIYAKFIPEKILKNTNILINIGYRVVFP